MIITIMIKILASIMEKILKQKTTKNRQKKNSWTQLERIEGEIRMNLHIRHRPVI